MAFAKGTGATDAAYAKGGATLGRTRDFLKEPDEFRDDGTKRAGPDDEDQNYAKAGPNAGTGMAKLPKTRDCKVIK